HGGQGASSRHPGRAAARSAPHPGVLLRAPEGKVPVQATDDLRRVRDGADAKACERKLIRGVTRRTAPDPRTGAGSPRTLIDHGAGRHMGTTDEKRLLDLFDRLTSEQQDKLIAFAEFLSAG